MSENRGNLVKLLDYDDEFIIDLKYATEDNFTGQKIYSSGECWMDRHTCEILIKAKNVFKEAGYKIKVLDAYRPISAQKKFWEIMPNDDFVARPPDMSKLKTFRPTHMNGLCVDITLTDLNGNEIEMPCPFDTLTEEASLDYPYMSESGRKNGQYLKEVMESVGFKAYKNEWWHFYDVTTEPTPFTDYPL